MKKILILTLAVFAFSVSSHAAGKSAKEYVADLKSTDDAVVIVAENWIGDNKEKTAIKDLVSLIKNSTNAEVRMNAAVALGLIGEKEAIEPLTDTIVSESSSDVRYAMLLAISRIGIDSKKSYNALMQAKEKETDPYIKDYIEKMEKKFSNKD
jgi:HEAT repeat protein